MHAAWFITRATWQFHTNSGWYHWILSLEIGFLSIFDAARILQHHWAKGWNLCPQLRGAKKLTTQFWREFYINNFGEAEFRSSFRPNIKGNCKDSGTAIRLWPGISCILPYLPWPFSVASHSCDAIASNNMAEDAGSRSIPARKRRWALEHWRSLDGSPWFQTSVLYGLHDGKLLNMDGGVGIFQIRGVLFVLIHDECTPLGIYVVNFKSYYIRNIYIQLHEDLYNRE